MSKIPETSGIMELLAHIFPDCTKSTKDCINAIENTNCDNMDKLADDIVTFSKLRQDGGQEVIQKFTNDWNKNIAPDNNNNLEKIGNFFGTLNKNMKCFRDSFNKYSKQNLNTPNNDFEKGLLKGTQSILKKNVYIILAVLFILMSLIDTFVQNKNIRLILLLLLLIISIVVVYIVK